MTFPHHLCPPPPSQKKIILINKNLNRNKKHNPSAQFILDFTNSLKLNIQLSVFKQSWLFPQLQLTKHGKSCGCFDLMGYFVKKHLRPAKTLQRSHVHHLYMLWTKGAHESAIFQTFTCSHKHSPNFLFHFFFMSQFSFKFVATKGNTCYINSILQALSLIPSFWCPHPSQFLKNQHAKRCPRNTES